MVATLQPDSDAPSEKNRPPGSRKEGTSKSASDPAQSKNLTGAKDRDQGGDQSNNANAGARNGERGPESKTVPRPVAPRTPEMTVTIPSRTTDRRRGPNEATSGHRVAKTVRLRSPVTIGRPPRMVNPSRPHAAPTMTTRPTSRRPAENKEKPDPRTATNAATSKNGDERSTPKKGESEQAARNADSDNQADKPMGGGEQGKSRPQNGDERATSKNGGDRATSKNGESKQASRNADNDNQTDKPAAGRETGKSRSQGGDDRSNQQPRRIQADRT